MQALRHMDSILFSLLILQTICDSKGQLWRSNPLHLYVVEVTIPQVNTYYNTLLVIIFIIII